MSHTILIIDDSQYMLELVKQALTHGSYNVIQAQDGSKGLEAIQNNEIHLVITDINMPVMDGVTFVKELRKTNKTLPVIVLTTESGEALKKEVMNMGASGWLVKPFRPVQLLNIVKETLS